MITTVTATTVVRAPLRQVYNQWTQFESFPYFMSSVDRIEQVDDVRTRWDVNVAGVKRSFDAAITDQIPDQVIRWESVDEEMHSGEVSFDEAPDGTRVTLTMGWVPDGFLERVGSALDIDERAAERDLERFKEFIEERASETGSWRGTIRDENVEGDDHSGRAGG